MDKLRIKNKLLLILLGFFIVIFVVTVYFDQKPKTETPQPDTASEEVTISKEKRPASEPKGYPEARDAVLGYLPYEKDDVRVEYLINADQILGTVQKASTVSEFRSKKQEAEKYLKDKGINICNLNIYWTGPKAVVNMKGLEPDDLLTSGCYSPVEKQ